MSIEEEVFQRSKISMGKLLKYGFKKNDDNYVYSKKIVDNNLMVTITINNEKEVSAKVYDLAFNEEYVNHRLENKTGEFASMVRNELQNALEDIKNNCTTKNYFISDQANRIANFIKEKYEGDPEFIWEKFPGYGVFRNKDNQKWYGLIVNINRDKLDDGNEEVEIINVKIDETKIQKLLARRGFYKAYHMNKANWVSIILDDTISDDEVMSCVVESHKFTEKSKEWIIPANPKYYDVINCFNNTHTINWNQSNNISVGDVVYLYITAPYKAILYKCEVLEVNIPYEYSDQNLSMKKAMKLKLMKKYDEKEFTFSKLKNYGINAIRGPRGITEELSKKLK